MLVENTAAKCHLAEAGECAGGAGVAFPGAGPLLARISLWERGCGPCGWIQYKWRARGLCGQRSRSMTGLLRCTATAITALPGYQLGRKDVLMVDMAGLIVNFIKKEFRRAFTYQLPRLSD